VALTRSQRPKAPPAPAKKQKSRMRAAKDDFGERLLRRNGSIDPDAETEF
jgi:hypothetical protein